MDNALLALLEVMVRDDGADLYLSPGAPPSMRVGADFVAVGAEPLTALDTERIADSLMTPRQREQFANDLEMNLAFGVDTLGRFRTNIMRQRGMVSLVIRQIKLRVPAFDTLGLPPILKSLALEPRGLVLVTGSTGSGKSTALAAMIDHRNSTKAGHIITLEDPMEYVHPHKKSVVNQREIGTDSHSYAEGLKNVLRQAPDMILIGEIRDRLTMEEAMRYAETGHLVLSTLHSINANQTLDRIMQFFPQELEHQIYKQLALTLRAVVSLRLVPRADGKGRVPAVEVMIASARIRELIARGDVSEIKNAMEASTQDGMISFDQCLLRLYGHGIITMETAMRYADVPGDIKMKMEGLASGTDGIRRA